MSISDITGHFSDTRCKVLVSDCRFGVSPVNYADLGQINFELCFDVCSIRAYTTHILQVHGALQVGELIDKFSIKKVEFDYQRTEREGTMENFIQDTTETAKKKTIRAFQYLKYLMAGGQTFQDKKKYR